MGSSPRSGCRGRLLSALFPAEVWATPQCRCEAALWTLGAWGPCEGREPGTGRGFELDWCFSGLSAPFCTTLLGWAAGVQV